METCLVIDRGTTKIKAALYDFEGNELSVAAVKCPDYQAQESAAEYSDKCVDKAASWTIVADELWNNSHNE